MTLLLEPSITDTLLSEPVDSERVLALNRGEDIQLRGRPILIDVSRNRVPRSESDLNRVELLAL